MTTSTNMQQDDVLPLTAQVLVLVRLAQIKAANQAILNEITEHQRTEKELEQLRHQNELLLNSAGEGIYGMDLAGHCTFINQAAAKMLGYERKQVLGQNMHNLIHHTHHDGDPYPVEQCPINLAFQNGKGSHVDSEVFWRRDGTSFPVAYSSYPLLDGEVIMGAVITFSDITRHKQAENALKRAKEELEIRVEERTSALRESNEQLVCEVVERRRAAVALRRSEERYRSLVEATCQIIWDTKAEGEFVTEQPSWSTFTGQTYEELKGWGWLNAVHPDDQLHTAQVWSTALANCTLYEVEHRLRRYDGEYRSMSVRAVPVLEDNGSVREWVGVQTDITERKQAEAEIQKAREQEKALLKERELSNLKSRFITTTSHEFRTPLATISLSAGLLKNYSNKWSDKKKLLHLERIEAAVERMSDLLEDVLLVGQAEARELRFHPALIELESFCGSLVKELQLGAGSKHEISFVNSDKFTSTRLDEKLLRHILTNLISNAIKYSPDGGLVLLELSCEEKAIVFQVKDQGIGIPKEDQPRLFEFFHRGTNVGNISGMGLGLAIVKKCVDLHSGQIALVSEVGFGTTFSVRIPFA